MTWVRRLNATLLTLDGRPITLFFFFIFWIEMGQNYTLLKRLVLEWWSILCMYDWFPLFIELILNSIFKQRCLSCMNKLCILGFETKVRARWCVRLPQITNGLIQQPAV